MIKFQNFSVSYLTHKVLNIDKLNIEEHKSIALIGPSGCGKTTLLYALADLLPSGANPSGLLEKPLGLTTNVVFQDYGLFPWKTVEENVLLPFTIQGNIKDSDRDVAIDLLKKLKLDHCLGQYPNTLSGGQKQRVSLARAWVLDADLLLLDEPFSALDAITREGLQDEVKSMQKSHPKTLIIVTHSIEEAVFLGQTIMIMTPSGHISEVVENPTFTLSDARSDETFYSKCIEIRAKLKGVQL